VSTAAWVLVLVATHLMMKGVLMARRGRKRRLDLESEYWLLLAAGIGTVEACRLLGIGRKTGYRWRAENGGIAPARLGEGVRSNRYLSAAGAAADRDPAQPGPGCSGDR
jgi:hypothetical protein